MISPGLVSITFRQLSPDAVIDLVAEANLRCIEWGADVHAPPGKTSIADRIRRRCDQAGLESVTYGSYYRLGESPPADFMEVMAVAMALGVSRIRVWAGAQGSASASASSRQAVIDEARRIADIAAAQQIGIVTEWHGGTLTDTNDSGLAMLDAVDHPDLHTYWQPAVGLDHQACLEGLRGIIRRDRLRGLHVFNWVQDGYDRLPLAEGEDRWLAYLSEVAPLAHNIPALLEFVQDDDPQNFLRDAATLRDWIRRLE